VGGVLSSVVVGVFSSLDVEVEEDISGALSWLGSGTGADSLSFEFSVGLMTSALGTVVVVDAGFAVASAYVDDDAGADVVPAAVASGIVVVVGACAEAAGFSSVMLSDLGSELKKMCERAMMEKGTVFVTKGKVTSSFWVFAEAKLIVETPKTSRNEKRTFTCHSHLRLL
jgi:hypothetical protein